MSSNMTAKQTVPCSAYDEIGGIVYFRRMVDKIRLHQAGKLPEEYVVLLGESNVSAFDARCCRFLHIRYEDLVAQAGKGLSDEQLFSWATDAGRMPTDTQKETWNAFMLKRGWRDETSENVAKTVQDNKLPDGIVTYFDLFDAEEGRLLRFRTEDISNTPLPTRPLLFPEMRSPYETLGGVVHLPRMLDKVRLHQAGKLPEEWVKAKGVATFFDGLCCEFLGVSYGDVEQKTLQGASDEDVLAFITSNGARKTAEEIKIFNTCLAKRGWRDAYVERLHFRLSELGLPPNTVSTMFDFIDLDEGRNVEMHKLLIF